MAVSTGFRFVRRAADPSNNQVRRLEMPSMSNLPKYAVIAVLVLGGAMAISKFFGRGDNPAFVNLTVPPLTQSAAAGKTLFDDNCASCHGTNAAGSENGPPLIHVIYEPGHHSDGSFFLAVSRGVRQHHWNFGNMPEQPNVSEQDTALIIEYVRALQVANEIR